MLIRKLGILRSMTSDPDKTHLNDIPVKIYQNMSSFF